MSENQRFYGNLQAQLHAFVHVSGVGGEQVRMQCSEVRHGVLGPQEAKADGSLVQGLGYIGKSCSKKKKKILSATTKRNRAGRLRFLFAVTPREGLEHRSSVVKLSELSWDESVTASAGRKPLCLFSN